MIIYSITTNWHGNCFFTGEKAIFGQGAEARLGKKFPTAIFMFALLSLPAYAAESHMDWIGYRFDYRDKFIVDETIDRAASRAGNSRLSYAQTLRQQTPQSQPVPIPTYIKGRYWTFDRAPKSPNRYHSLTPRSGVRK